MPADVFYEAPLPRRPLHDCTNLGCGEAALRAAAARLAPQLPAARLLAVAAAKPGGPKPAARAAAAGPAAAAKPATQAAAAGPAAAAKPAAQAAAAKRLAAGENERRAIEALSGLKAVLAKRRHAARDRSIVDDSDGDGAVAAGRAAKQQQQLAKRVGPEQAALIVTQHQHDTRQRKKVKW